MDDSWLDVDDPFEVRGHPAFYLVDFTEEENAFSNKTLPFFDQVLSSMSLEAIIKAKRKGNDRRGRERLFRRERMKRDRHELRRVRRGVRGIQLEDYGLNRLLSERQVGGCS